MIGAIVGARVGGAGGAALWAGVGYFTGYEVGWIAWGVGVLAGLGAAAGARGSAGTATGLLAAVVALMAVGAGKLAVVELHIQNDQDFQLASEFTHEVLLTYVADQVAEQWEDDGVHIDWPPLPKNQMFRWREAEYPPDLWADTLACWDEHTPQQQAEVREGFRKLHEKNIREAEQFYAEYQSHGMFSPFDAIWIILAVASAFGIGRGGADD